MPRIDQSWEWMHDRVKSEMSPALRRLLEPLLDFDRFLSAQLSTYRPYKSFKPLCDYIDSVRGSLAEGIAWIERYDDNEIEHEELVEFLESDAAESLEEALDDTPDLVGTYPNVREEIDELLNDVESWFEEHVVENISQRGYHIYHLFKNAL